MPDNVQHNTAPDSGAIAATDDRNPQSPLMDSHFDALLAKQRARDALHNDRLHHTTVSLPRSSSSCRTAPCSAITLRWRARQRDRQAFTNDLLRSAVTDLEDELILHIKKRCKLRNDAAKSSSDVLPEQLACSYDQPPSTPKGNMVVSLMDLVVTRRKGKLKTLLEEYDLVPRPRDRAIISLDYEDADFLDCWEPSTRDDEPEEWEAVGEPLESVLTYAEVV